MSDLPDGTYHGEDHSDNDCFRKMDIAIRVALTVRGDEIVADFSRSDPQILGFKNSSLANTYSAVFPAVFSTPRCHRNGLPVPDSPRRHTLSHGHPRRDDETSSSPTKSCMRCAPSPRPTRHAPVQGGQNHARPAQVPTTPAWVMHQWHAMGTPGATAERDGFVQMGHLITLGGLDLPNLEFHEQMYPVRLHPP